MSEPRRGAAPQAPADGPGPLEAAIESLRSQGAWRLDPARFHYLVALSRRMAGQQEPVLGLLKQKLQAALTDYAERLAQRDVRAMRRPPAQAGTDASCAPLAQLNHYIRGARPADTAAAALGETQEPDELASVRRFRRAWDTSRTQDQVEQAVSRKPVNAGPLNSHVLVLQSLDLMRGLSPDYLRRFLVHAQALQWLDQASQKYPNQPAKQTRAAVKTARRSRQKE